MDRAFEIAVDAIDEAEDGGRFDTEHLARQLESRSGVSVMTVASRAMAWMRTRRPSSGSSSDQTQRILGIAFGAFGLLVHFHEYTVDSGRDAGRGHRLDELCLPRGDAVPGARQLQAVRHVVDDRAAEPAENGNARMSTTRL